MNLRTVLLAFSLASLSACGGPKAPVIVVVSVDRVAQESVRAQRLVRDVEDYAKAAEAKLNQMLQEFQAASSDPSMPPQNLALMRDRLNQMRQSAGQQVDQKQSEAEREIHKMLQSALADLAKEQHWDLVIRKDRQSALWAVDALDKTDLVIQRMDAPTKSEAPRS